MLGIIGAVTGAVAAPLSMVALPSGATSVAVSNVGVTQTVATQQGSKGGGGGGGTGNQASASQEPDPNDPRLAKFTLKTSCTDDSPAKDQVNNQQVVLRNGKLYLDALDPASRQFSDGHPFAGFYIDYVPITPPPRGLVSTISQDPPELNWIYADATTLELKYGNKTASINNIVGPWDWTDGQEALTLEGWEGFVAMEESEGAWVVCYDKNEDYLANIRGDKLVLGCGLERVMVPTSTPAATTS